MASSDTAKTSSAKLPTKNPQGWAPVAAFTRKIHSAKKQPGPARRAVPEWSYQDWKKKAQIIPSSSLPVTACVVGIGPLNA
ncbi:hypothetical protein BST95_09860 [Halioglobus japonicus]|uniref:Uncharacterized protein n=1 Tax=Halioglobus japonicus TaxID=930805 RepID=A0AAP8MF36_9GAMM|nr:hypothetical protein BST95_09860 [Halioglobus japonicus]PLW86514.1 hypothetical protein C0029_08895 [Halioglobus japonicus]